MAIFAPGCKRNPFRNENEEGKSRVKDGDVCACRLDNPTSLGLSRNRPPSSTSSFCVVVGVVAGPHKVVIHWD